MDHGARILSLGPLGLTGSEPMAHEARIVHVRARSLETPQGEDVRRVARGGDPGEDYDLLANDEAFSVLEGEFLVQVGEDQQRFAAGSYAFGPRGVPHAYRNIGDSSARLLVYYTPGHFGSFSETLEELGPLDLDDEADPERVLPIFEGYGIEMEGPPIQEGS